MLDFSNADDQQDFAQGPVPSGSIVIVEMAVLEPHPDRQAGSSGDDRLISVSRNSLRQIYCQFTVTKGAYAGVSFRQNITLPCSAQTISLSPNYEKACNIGASMLKAMCVAAGRQPRVNSLRELGGLRFPVRVKINPRSSQGSNGQEYWNNEIARVITPDKEEYGTVRQEGEIINPNGAVTGKAAQSPAPGSSAQTGYYDEPPF